MKFQLLSSAFKDGENIPDIYTDTRKGENLSPPLHWINPPQGTKSFAILVQDNYLPFFPIIHWLIYDIPVNTLEFTQGVKAQGILPDGITQGRNWKRETGYTGPNPFWGRHAYCFNIYAIDTVIESDIKLKAGLFLKIIEKHVLATAQLIGYYSK